MPTRGPFRIQFLALALAAPLLCAHTHAQTTYTLDNEQWVQTDAPEPGSPEALIAEARLAIAEERPGRARSILTRFIDEHDRSGHPLLAEAYRLRGDAKLAQGKEFKALYDYESTIKRFPESDSFVIAVQRELEIGLRYAYGLRMRIVGLRLEPAGELAEEILIRVQERMPGSVLAERAAIELADYYFRNRDWGLAAEAYDLYLLNFPDGPNRVKAMKRRIYSEIAGYQGPRHDSSPLIEARQRIRNFMALYPAEAEQSGLDQSLITRVDESLAQSTLETGKWYLRVNDEPAARLTLHRLLVKQPQTTAAREAARIFENRGWDLPSGYAPAPAAPTRSDDSEADAQ